MKKEPKMILKYKWRLKGLELETIIKVKEEATLFSESFRTVNSKTIKSGTSEIVCQSIDVLWQGPSSNKTSQRNHNKDCVDKIYKDISTLPAEKRNLVYEATSESVIQDSDTILIIGRPFFNIHTSKNIKNKKETAIGHIRSVIDVYVEYHRNKTSLALIVCGHKSLSFPIPSKTFNLSSREELSFFSFSRRNFFRRF